MVGAQARGEQEAFAELQRVEQVGRGGGGLAGRIGAVVGPGQAGGIPVRVVQAGRGPAAAAGGGLAAGLEFLAGELQAGGHEMLHAAGGELALQVQLVGDDAVVLVLEGRGAAGEGVGGQVAPVGPLDVAAQRIGQRAAGAHERGQQVVLPGLAPAGDVADAQVLGEVVLELQRGHLRGRVVVVGARAVEVLRVHRMPGQLLQARLRRPARQADGRHVAVGHVLLLDVVQVQEHASVGAQTEAQRRGQAPAGVVDVVAAGHVAVLPHRVDAQRAAGAEGLVPVGGGAALAVDAGRHGARDAVAQVRLLGHHVDRTGRRGTAGVGAGRALQHFHPVGVEHVAGHRTQVAHAVHEEAARGVEAAHVDGVAGAGVAVLAGVEGAHARAVAQRLGQRGGALLVEQVAGDHLHGLRRVLQRLGVLGRGGDVFLVGLLAVHVDPVQRPRPLAGGVRVGIGLVGGKGRQRQRQAGGEGADQRGLGQDGTAGMLARLDVAHEQGSRG